MTRLTTILLITAILLISGQASATTPQVRLNPVDEAVNISAVDASPVDAERLDIAVARFRKAGLDLPALDVYFTASSARCKGAYGLFQPQFEPRRVTICSELPFVIVHELAHAWESAELNFAERERYRKYRGFSNWNDHDVAWADRGAEDAAFIVQHNLMATNPPKTSSTWQERASAYEVLTGELSPLREGWGLSPTNPTVGPVPN